MKHFTSLCFLCLPLVHKDFSWPHFPVWSFSHLQKVDPKIVIKKKNQFINSLASICCCKSHSQQMLNRLSFPICSCVLFRQLWHFYLLYVQETKHLPIAQLLYIHKTRPYIISPSLFSHPVLQSESTTLISNFIWPSMNSLCYLRWWLIPTS